MSIFSQDIHYSQFFNSPTALSPGLTGIFSGNYRMSGNYRSQWADVPVDYKTFGAAYDMKFGDIVDTSGFWSAGAEFYHDNAGDLGFKKTSFGASASYSLRLDKGIYMTPGLGVTFAQRNFDMTSIRSGNQWNGDVFDPSISPEMLATDNLSFLDISGGLNFRFQSSHRTRMDIGAGANNLLSVAQSFNENDTPADLERRFSFYGMGSLEVASKFDILLNALYQAQSPHSEVVLNAQGKMYLNKNGDRDIALIIGGGLRLDDSWYPMVALQMKSIYVGLSYDFTTSEFEIANDGKGGLEIAVQYRITKIPSAIFKPCPIY